jgi:hypothetical protein
MLPQLTSQDLNTLSTTQLLPLGTRVFLAGDQGRRGYTYVQFGGTSTVASGLLLVTPSAPATSTGLALPTTNSTTQLSLGSKMLYVTNGATAVTANQFADGQLEVYGTNGIEAYRIVGNSADSAGSAQLEVDLAEGLRNTTALANGTNTVNLRQSPALSVAASMTIANPVGVTIQPVPNTASVTYYGWVQSYGQAFVAATTAVKGQAITQDTAGTPGYVMSTAAATSYEIGRVIESVSSTYANVFLTLG